MTQNGWSTKKHHENFVQKTAAESVARRLAHLEAHTHKLKRHAREKRALYVK